MTRGIKQVASNSTSIKIVMPEGFSTNGDTQVLPEEKKLPPGEEILTLLYKNLEQLEALKQETIRLISITKKTFGCSGCGQK